VGNGNVNPNKTVMDTLASVVATQEQWDVVPTDKQPADDSVAVADKAAVAMVVEVAMEMVELVQLLQHLLVIKAMVVDQCQPTVQGVLADVVLNLVLEDRSDVVDGGVLTAEQMNMMDRTVSSTKHIEQVKMRDNDNKDSNVVLRQTPSPRLEDKM
jgi:hypothetical protein